MLIDTVNFPAVHTRSEESSSHLLTKVTRLHVRFCIGCKGFWKINHYGRGCFIHWREVVLFKGLTLLSEFFWGKLDLLQSQIGSVKCNQRERERKAECLEGKRALIICSFTFSVILSEYLIAAHIYLCERVSWLDVKGQVCFCIVIGKW